jgi:hypothetical protein
MRSLLLAAATMVFAATATLSPAPAATLVASGTTAGHYEWQYHYGKKARFEGHWVLVR